MRNLHICLAIVTVLWSVRSSSAASIDLSDPKIARRQGVKLDYTGPSPDEFPVLMGVYDVLGATPSFINQSPQARMYSGTATFDHPVSSVLFGVTRLNNSGWSDPFTFDAFDNGKLIGVKSMGLLPLGEVTDVQFSAPAITSVAWKGTNWVFHPYAIEKLLINFAPIKVASPPIASTPKISAIKAIDLPTTEVSPSVGTPSSVPEPAGAGIIILTGWLVILMSRPNRKPIYVRA